MSAPPNIKEFWDFVNERHAIYIRKYLREGGDIGEMYGFNDKVDYEQCDPHHFANNRNISAPFTHDEVMKTYRFCNVFRELDRVTVWIRKNIQEPFADHEHLWFMLAIARTINWPGTLQHLIDTPGAWPSHSDFSLDNLGAALDAYKASGEKVYTGAYMIRAESNPKAEWYSWTKQQYVAKIVLGRLWEDRERFTDMDKPMPVHRGPGDVVPEFTELKDVWNWLQDKRYIGWGPFMAGQVVTDLRHSRYLNNAADIEVWTALGPGSRRGLNRLYGRDVNTPLNQQNGLRELIELSHSQNTYKADWVPHIELSDVQNCCCEFDKIMRVRSGDGRPRAKYVAGRGY